MLTEPLAGSNDSKRVLKVKGNLLKEENIYVFNKDDIKNLSQRVLMKDDTVMYRREPGSNRHRGLTPMMVSILRLIYKARKIAAGKQKKFIGLTLYDCQVAFNVCGISNDTVRDNIRKLWKNLKFLDITKIRKSSKSEMTYYNINEDRFPCKDGTFILGDDGEQGGNFWAISCTVYPFCSCLPSDCTIVTSLKALKVTLTAGYLKGLEERMGNWMVIEKDMSTLANELIDILSDKYPEHKDLFQQLTESEVRYFAEEIRDIDDENEFSKELENIKDEVVKVIGVEKKEVKTRNDGKKNKKGMLDDIP